MLVSLIDSLLKLLDMFFGRFQHIGELSLLVTFSLLEKSFDIVHMTCVGCECLFGVCNVVLQFTNMLGNRCGLV